MSLCPIRAIGADTELLRRRPEWEVGRESATPDNQAYKHVRLIAAAEDSLHLYKRISEEKNRCGVNFFPEMAALA